MIFTPTNTIPGNFDAVSSEDIQSLAKKDIEPIPGASRTGRYSIIFTLESEKPDVEWKYASAADRDTDYDAIIAAANAGSGIVPTLQQVTDQGATTTNIITADSFVDSEGPVSSQFARFNLVAADILTLGSVGFDLLTDLDPGNNTYYDVEAVYIEFTEGAAAYTSPDKLALVGCFVGYFSEAILEDTTGAGTRIVSINRNSIETAPGIPPFIIDPIGLGLRLVMENGTDPIGGDGTMRVVVKHKIRIFGVS